MKRKLLSIFLAFAMSVSLLTVGASAVEPTYGDIAGHWAEASIERWSSHGIIQGNNGKFNPNGQLTCAHFAAILARLLKLPAAKDAGFSDNTPDAWHYDAINRCAAAGILKGNLNGTVTPNAPITRERAMVMLGRALGIEPIENPDLTQFTDGAQVASYARGMLAALIRAGIVGGVTADQLAPQNNITRAATVTILDRAIGTYADKAGETVNADGKGIVLVVADDVTVTGEVNKLLVPANDIEVTVKGSKNIDDITVSGDNSKVILDNASADNVTLDGEKSAVETKNGAKIDNVIMSENASGAAVDAGSGTTIGNVENHAEDATVTGSGTVKKVESDKDITVKTKDTDVKNIGDEKITVTDKSGKDTTVGTTGSGSSTTVNKGTTSSGGGGGGSSSGSSHSHSHSYADAWSHDATHHWHASTCGHEVVSGKAEHTWNDGEVTKAATCGAAGEKTLTCTVCGATKTEAIAATGVHTPVEVPAQAATCTEAGHAAGKQCSVCGTIISGMEEIPALGHDWGDYVITHAVSGRDGTKTHTCSRCNTTEDEKIPYKFYLGVTSGSTVDMTVGGDYTAMITLPKAGATVNAGSIDLTAKMQDVASLGVEGEKSHTTTISTGLGEMDVVLSGKLQNCYKFDGAAINANVDGTSCTYNIGAINKDGELYTIEAAPADIDDARAAWQELTKHVTTSTQGSDDSKIVIKNGAYLMIGTEKLQFEDGVTDDLVLNNLSDMAALNTTIREHIKLTDCPNQGGTITMYLPAGTQLAVGGSVATLKDNCTITITLDPDEMVGLSTALSSLKNETDPTMMVKELVKQFDNLVGAIGADGDVDVNVRFSA